MILGAQYGALEYFFLGYNSWGNLLEDEIESYHTSGVWEMQVDTCPKVSPPLVKPVVTGCLPTPLLPWEVSRGLPGV